MDIPHIDRVRDNTFVIDARTPINPVDDAYPFHPSTHDIGRMTHRAPSSGFHILQGRERARSRPTPLSLSHCTTQSQGKQTPTTIIATTSNSFTTLLLSPVSSFSVQHNRRPSYYRAAPIVDRQPPPTWSPRASHDQQIANLPGRPLPLS